MTLTASKTVCHIVLCFIEYSNPYGTQTSFGRNSKYSNI